MVSQNLKSQSPVLLVDGSNLLMRVFHARQAGGAVLSEPELIESSAMIFMSQLVHYIGKYEASAVYIGFDKGGSLRRKRFFSEYKANREFQASALSSLNENTQELLPIYTTLRDKTVELCRSFNLPVFMEFGIEADDFIGIAVEQLTMLGKHSIILSNDSDFLQLLSTPSVTCVIPYKKREVTIYNFASYFEEVKGISISSREYILYKAIVGDKSDNINGIKGIGFKTLHKYFEESLSNDPIATTLYLEDPLLFLDTLAQRSSTKFEKKIGENLDLIKRNYKLIDLTSAEISSYTIKTTVNLLANKPDKPKRMKILQEYVDIFNVSANLTFIQDTLRHLDVLYVKDIA